MLDTTLSTSFIPATNIKGQANGANWSYLLPSLEHEQVICFGLPSQATLKTLSRCSQEVVIVNSRVRHIEKIDELSQKPGMARIRSVAHTREALSKLMSGNADLVLVSGWLNIMKLLRNQLMWSEIRRLLKPDALLYFEFRGPFGSLLNSKSVEGLQDGFDILQQYWVTPLTGEAQTAVPESDQKTIDYFFRHKLYSPTINLTPFDRIERSLIRHPLFRSFFRRHGFLMGRRTGDSFQQPPQYLQSITKTAGINLEHYRWGLVARGKYNSRKVLFFLFDREDKSPEYIVKMTRDPSFNLRLENEYRALKALSENNSVDMETIPQAVFWGYHSNLAVLGETVIEGTPFRKQMKGTQDCPSALSAVEWFIELAVNTGDATLSTPVEVAVRLEHLFKQFINIYQLTEQQHTFLDEQIRAIGSRSDAFPLVFQHGDPGIWNIMITQSGRAAFLDWEAADARGMPLWDLFYFLRSYCASTAKSNGIRNGLRGFSQYFLADSSLSPMVIDATRRYCERTNLPGYLVEPLFYTCWMHRALKEATRLSRSKLQNGHYVNLLKLCIDQWKAPTLQQIFSI